jgi:hypothetical protein
MIDIILLLLSFAVLSAVIVWFASMRDVPNPNCFNDQDNVAEGKCPFGYDKNDQRNT